MKSISSASKLRQWQVWRTEICAVKVRKFNISSDTLGAPANDIKNRWQSMNWYLTGCKSVASLPYQFS
jgi:hypothetical protein